MCQASTCGRVLARALVQVLQNSASWMVVLRFATLSTLDRQWRNPRKKNSRHNSPPATDFLAYRTVILGFFNLNIKATDTKSHNIPEFLNANLWPIHLITFNIDWSWNIFTSHNWLHSPARGILLYFSSTQWPKIWIRCTTSRRCVWQSALHHRVLHCSHSD